MMLQINHLLNRLVTETEAKEQLAQSLSKLWWLLLIYFGIFTALASSSALLISAAAVGQPPLVGDYLLIKKYPDQQTIQPGENARFTIIVSNIDADVDLKDVTVQDLIAPDCSREIGDLPSNSDFPTYNCFLNNVQAPVVDWAIVKGVNPADGESDQARDSAIVDIIDAIIDIEATPSTLASPGGPVDFSVDILNTGSVTVVLQSLTSPQLGNLVDPGNALLSENECSQLLQSPVLIPVGNSANCNFRSEIVGKVGNHPILVSAMFEDETGNTITRSANETIEMTTPVRHNAYLPISFARIDEPNDTCADAVPLSADVIYYFFPEDSDDWYFFELDKKEEVLVELSNFLPRLGQIVIYKGADCRSLQILRNNGNDQDAKPVPLGIQPPGRYYILVVNAGKPSNQVPYQLVVHIQ